MFWKALASLQFRPASRSGTNSLLVQRSSHLPLGTFIFPVIDSSFGFLYPVFAFIKIYYHLSAPATSARHVNITLVWIDTVVEQLTLIFITLSIT